MLLFRVEREACTQTQEDVFSICQFTPQMHVVARAGPGTAWSSTQVFMWVAGTPVLVPLFAASQAHCQDAGLDLE